MTAPPVPAASGAESTAPYPPAAFAEDVRIASGLEIRGGRVAPWHALEGEPFVPPPAVASGALALTRDDDLYTGWQCPVKPGGACAIGLRFAGTATVHAVRLVWGIADSPLSGLTGAFPSKVRIQSDSGQVDVVLPPQTVEGGEPRSAGMQHLILRRPLVTCSLLVTVLAVHPGRHAGTVRVAELDALGTGAPARPRWAVDLDRTFIRRSRRLRVELKRPGNPSDYVSTDAWLEQEEPSGKVRRVLPAQRLDPTSGGRYWLIRDHGRIYCGFVGCSWDRDLLIADRDTRLIHSLRTAFDPRIYDLREYELKASDGFLITGEVRDERRAQPVLRHEILTFTGGAKGTARLAVWPEPGNYGPHLDRLAKATPQTQWFEAPGPACPALTDAARAEVLRRIAQVMPKDEYLESKKFRCWTAGGFTLVVHGEGCRLNPILALLLDAQGKVVSQQVWRSKDPEVDGRFTVAPRPGGAGRLAVTMGHEAIIYVIDPTGQLQVRHRQAELVPYTDAGGNCGA